MTASADRVNFELRTAFAKVENYVIRGSGRLNLGGVDLLLGVLAPEQPRPAGLEGLLHVHVSACQPASAPQGAGERRRSPCVLSGSWRGCSRTAPPRPGRGAHREAPPSASRSDRPSRLLRRRGRPCPARRTGGRPGEGRRPTLPPRWLPRTPR